MSTPVTTEQPTTEPQQGTTTPPTGDATGDTKGGDERRFSKAEMDAIVQDRLDRDRKARERDNEKSRREAEEKALKEQSEWQKLAEKHAARISELEPLHATVEETNAQLGRYKGALEAHLATQRDSLPDHIMDLLDRFDPVDQLEWLAKNRELLGQQRGGNGIPTTPRPAGPMTTEQATEVEIQKRLRTGIYNI